MILSDITNFDQIFRENLKTIGRRDTEIVSEYRADALNHLLRLGLPTSSNERWRNTDISKALQTDYSIFFEDFQDQLKPEDYFTCEVGGLDTWLITLLNGWYTFKNSPLRILPSGTIIGSLSRAMVECPELVENHLGKAADNSENAFTAMNSAFATDGFFIYVPDGVEVTKTIQMVNVVSHTDPIFVQTRNLVILGKNSKLRLAHCDDSHNHNPGFTNSVTEIIMAENSNLDHYKLQNINDHSTLINNTYIHQEAGSKCTTNALSLHGGFIRNEIFVKLNGRESSVDVYGLYLMDKKQAVDNYVFIDHAAADCTSTEMFKGILDDYAHAVFNGHILVRKDSQRTIAYQSNRNILLTDKAQINSKPFLEIYADDVKCSHGATVGQLDTNAMFYLRSRGISEDNARLLLMYAFAAEIINKISIESLRDRLDDMVKKRLRGELSICDQCVLHCKTPDKPIEFEIDLSKV